ncbi:glycoside hydrolase family 130 protein [Carboxylicivirga linearis]|uniref:Glycoside hydrolase family 130 protein n=1 Tax=Carboxylicivirga linearis TaxID=1628157 RepID=A0ABS5K137_9BACT|nr:glycoside hydrolase family 130 protein [Carboxylicivirga linearis]MBS2100866.1 glycoside hydrolase family 130 protein [Carboxylicivirga linearis]
MLVSVIRKNITFNPDPSRVIARFLFTEEQRAINTIRFVVDMNEDEASFALKQTLRDYSMRHRNISKIFEKHFNRIRHLLPLMNVLPDTIGYSKKILIGSYFTMEYSIESAAFFNPSMVEHPDQSEISPEAKRVILSFRATGEGHISSIVFRTGIIDKNNKLTLEPIGNLLEEAEHIRRHTYNKSLFAHKLDEMEVHGIIPPALILDKLKEEFTYGELRKCIEDARKAVHLASDKEFLFNQIIWLASSHYELQFSLDTNISERVIFPVSANERNGIEDARFVKFVDDDNTIKYYATYTAYDGATILPKLLETEDFYHFKVMPLHGEIAKNKGMALFPRKINGKYAMLCRIDGFNNYIAFSDNITVWREAQLLQQPKYPWELIQIGNCGSPVETKDGWLVITHGVGPMREYALGAALFDLDNPEREIGRSKTPLLFPNSDEREGYVPNVVYSCGSIVHNNDLIIPYAMSDYSSTYASVNLKELINELKGSK